MDYKKAFVLAFAICIASQPAMAEFCIGKTCFGKDAKAATGKKESKPAAAAADKPTGKGKPAHVTIWKPREKARAMTHEQRASGNSYKRAVRSLSYDMNSIRYTGNSDVDFALVMLPHHQGAVDLAEAQLMFGKDPELKDLAMRTIIWQKAQIGRMKQWVSGRRSDWRAENVHDRRSVRAYKTAVQNMRCGLKIKYTGNADVDFASTLIPHHQGAVEIAWVQKEYGTDRTMRKMASDTIRSQSEEIRWIEDWLSDKQI